MDTSYSVSSSNAVQRKQSSEDNKEQAAYNNASDPAYQAANAAPYMANVPFTYNNNSEPSTSEQRSISVSSIPQGDAGGMSRHPDQRGGGGSSYQRGPTPEQIRYEAQGREGPIQYGSPQSSSAPTKVDLNNGLNDGNVRIKYSAGRPNGSNTTHERLSIETGQGNDAVYVTEGRNGGVLAQVNGRSYEIPFEANRRNQQTIDVKTGDGNDSVVIDNRLAHDVNINLGRGDDSAFAGSGRTKIYGGSGQDNINLGSGEGYAEGGDGDDFITGGSGHATIYGGPGSDEIRAGGGPDTKINYVDGGDGRDLIYGGRGRNVLFGGNGDDYIYAGDSSTIVPGKGNDWVQTRSRNDHVIGERADDLSHVHPSSSFEHTIPSPDAGARGINIQGSPSFTQRVKDDLEALRSTRAGQETLKIIDSLDAPVTLKEGVSGSFYYYDDPGGRRMPPPEQGLARTPGVIKNGVAGTPAQNPAVEYDRSFIAPGHQRPPLVILQHELSHAVNGGRGTILPGSSLVWNGRGLEWEANYERQAVGLPTSSYFDFDRNPRTPPTNTNPWPYNENALLNELGLPLRQRYGD
ncbi:M91 family zinc metallopeptidase [Pseudomonas sp. FP2335]|uniref:M91 family zinc metallopeptidase n=1 Tax=Pseudomonas sp. FP2335 TaxID=2954092 RepID=UPI0027368CDA|nr:M91 family zinc metallopeptidase [Pseudomonas sp. FP2335]WLH80262.1 M91 family zinc metallopeptidase [Pseudomonas sp. FP2335]